MKGKKNVASLPSSQDAGVREEGEIRNNTNTQTLTRGEEGKENLSPHLLSTRIVPRLQQQRAASAGESVCVPV